MNEKAIQKALKNASPGGTISCSEAFVLSKTQGIPIGMIGKAANELGIKILGDLE